MMALTVREGQALAHCIKWQLLDPIPEIIIWHGHSLTVRIPPTRLKHQATYDDWKAELGEQLPLWVRNLKESFLFYDKVTLLSSIVVELDCCQQLPMFFDRYRKGVAAKQSSPAKDATTPITSGESAEQTAPEATAASAPDETADAAANDGQAAADDLTAALGL